jgi:hypothetical protein
MNTKTIFVMVAIVSSLSMILISIESQASFADEKVDVDSHGQCISNFDQHHQRSDFISNKEFETARKISCEDR